VPAVPAFAIAASLLLGPSVEACVRRLSSGFSLIVVRGLTVMLLVGAAAGAVVPALGRDRQRLADIAAIEALVPRDAVVGICPSAMGLGFARVVSTAVQREPGCRGGDTARVVLEDGRCRMQGRDVRARQRAWPDDLADAVSAGRLTV
jgi:hypothetical protein